MTSIHPQMKPDERALLAGFERFQSARGGALTCHWTTWDEPTYCTHEGFVIAWSSEGQRGETLELVADLSILRASHAACRWVARGLPWRAPRCQISGLDPVQRDRVPEIPVPGAPYEVFTYTEDPRFAARLRDAGLAATLTALARIAAIYVWIDGDRLEVGVGNRLDPAALDALAELGAQLAQQVGAAASQA